MACGLLQLRADCRDGLQVRLVAANVLSDQWQTINEKWPPCMWVKQRLRTSHRNKSAWYEILQKDPRL
jgi:hypothetical protein